MDPALLNYLQSQAQQEQAPDMGQEMPMQAPQMQAPQMPMQAPPMQAPPMQAPQMQAPQMPMQAPPMQAPQMQAPQEQAPYNPFDSGIQKAISSARESLGMTEQQQDRALRNSILTFGDNIGQQPRQKGFWNNFGSAARALSPAIRDYDNSEDAALTQNNALANQILNRQAAEQQRQSQLEDTNWKRGFDEEQFATKKQQATDQLAEQARYHDLMKPKPAGNEGGNEGTYDKKTLDHIHKKNIDHSEDIYKKNKTSEITTKALTSIKDVLAKERDAGSWQQGSGLSAKISRYVAASAGKNDAQKEILLKRMPLFGSLKEMFGARITNLDLELFIKSLPGLDQPPEVAIAELEQRINNEKLSSKERSLRQEIVEDEFNNKVPFYSTQVNKRVEERMGLAQEPDNLEKKVEPKTGITLYDPAINKTYYNVTPEHAQHYLSQNPNLVQQ